MEVILVVAEAGVMRGCTPIKKENFYLLAGFQYIEEHVSRHDERILAVLGQ